MMSTSAVVAAGFNTVQDSVAQDTIRTGEIPTDTSSVIIFESPYPLLDNADADKPATWGAGLDVLFSNSGWGAAGFVQHAVAADLMMFAHLGISGKRNTDELETLLPNNMAVVIGKVNRLFIVPLTIGFQYRLFSESLQESFRPFISAGITPTLVLSTPYIQNDIYYEFFSSFGHTTVYPKVGASVGIGAFFGSIGKGNILGVQVRYLTIPFGGVGIESMAGNPIQDLGGVFLSLTVGSAW